MVSVLSIDLACSAKNLGICLLTTREKWSAPFLRCTELNIADPLDARDFANSISDFCRNQGVRVLLIDGPQAWKDPDSELPHCRACEKKLATPAKTGARGIVKPMPFYPFVQFSIKVFDFLVSEFGAQLATSEDITAPGAGFLALESYPTSAWRALNLTPLPGKKKSKPSDIADRVVRLTGRYNLAPFPVPSHDELQALVAALAGPAILKGDSSGYRAHGTAPTKKNGVWVEGYIVNPSDPASAPDTT